MEEMHCGTFNPKSEKASWGKFECGILKRKNGKGHGDEREEFELDERKYGQVRL